MKIIQQDYAGSLMELQEQIEDVITKLTSVKGKRQKKEEIKQYQQLASDYNSRVKFEAYNLNFVG